MKLTSLRPAHIQALHGTCAGEKLSPRTIVQHHRIVREALKHAVQWQLLPNNPADSVDPPRFERREMSVLNEQQVISLLSQSAASYLGPIVYLALHTGARSGELLALRWSDIDLGNRQLSIVRTVQRLSGEGLVFRPTKTHRSRRSLTLSSDAVLFLKEHRKAQNEQRLRVGPAWQDHDLVFAREDGTPYEPGVISKAFARLLVEAKLPKIRFHDLRHTAATLLLSAKIHPKVVSERLGHASIHITLDTYSHVIPNLQEEAAQAMDRVLKRGG